LPFPLPVHSRPTQRDSSTQLGDSPWGGSKSSFRLTTCRTRR
jgi:hypothetical protein